MFAYVCDYATTYWWVGAGDWLVDMIVHKLVSYLVDLSSIYMSLLKSHKEVNLEHK